MILNRINYYSGFICLCLTFPVRAELLTELEDNVSLSSITTTEAAISINEPMYFVAGGRGDIKGRFQFSFKYRVFDEGSDMVKDYAWLKGFHFAYTQTSLWNLSANSAPFEDSSYRPSLFWDFNVNLKNYLPVLIRTGYEHESNGRADVSSRSINTLFFSPFWNGQMYQRDLIVSPKFYAYFTRGEFNEDIDDYRGNIDLLVRYGNEDDLLVSTLIRHGSKNRSMFQFDISYPVRKKIFSRAGGYIYLQVTHGYGESLITYNEKQDLQFRIGFAIVR